MSTVAKYVPCGRSTVEARIDQTGAEPIALVEHLAAELREVRVGELQPHGDRVLERTAAHVGEELLRRLHRGHELGRSA